MKNIFSKKYFVILTGLLLVSTSVVLANDEMFQNNLLKMDINKTPQGGVKVTLYTKKPYNDSVVVNKKSDKEYVILMPETANSLTAKPTLKSASDVVQNVEVKTQQYSANKGQKGYTKIVVSTSKPIEITSKTQTMSNSDYLLNENDYKELMAQTGKKHGQTSANKSSTRSSATVATATAPRPRALKRGEQISHSAQNTAKSSISTQKSAKKITAKAAPKTAPVAIQQKTAKTTSNPIKAESKKAPKVIAEKTPTQIKTETAPAQVDDVQTVTAPVNTTTQTVQENTALNKTAPSEVQPQTTPAPTPHVGRLQKIKHLIKSNLYIALALLFIPLFLLLLLLRSAGRTMRGLQQQKENFSSNLDEKPSPTRDYTEEFNDEMSWKEKFKTYVDSNSPETEQQPHKVDNKDLDGLFGNEGEEEIAETEEEEAILEDVPDSEELSELDAFGALEGENEAQGEEFSIDEVFGEEENFEGVETQYSEEYYEETFTGVTEEQKPEFEQSIFPFMPTAEEEKEDELIQSRFAIDSEKGIYLVDFEGSTSLVGQIDEEIFVLKRFDNPIKGALQARLSEKKGPISTYMVKAEGFKALVEVTSENMKLLIEL